MKEQRKSALGCTDTTQIQLNKFKHTYIYTYIYVRVSMACSQKLYCMCKGLHHSFSVGLRAFSACVKWVAVSSTPQDIRCMYKYDRTHTNTNLFTLSYGEHNSTGTGCCGKSTTINTHKSTVKKIFRLKCSKALNMNVTILFELLLLFVFGGTHSTRQSVNTHSLIHIYMCVHNST